MRDDWFRRHSWTEADQAEFFARLGRSRSPFHKAQHARIQACELHHAGGARHARAALELLDTIVESWMGDAQRAPVHHQRAECLRDLGGDAEAVEAYRETFTEDTAELKHSGLRYPPAVGLVRKHDDPTHAMLTSIAAG